MKRSFAALSSILALLASTFAQNPTQPPQQPQVDDILRITTELVQTDVVVTDKSDQIVPDLKLGDFEVFDNGKRQELQFVEFVNTQAQRSAEQIATGPKIPDVDTSVARDLTARDIRRVMAFVVDDVTIPVEDMVRVRQLLMDFVDNKMQEGDLVAIVRTVGGQGLLEQFTSDRQILRRAIAQLGVRSIPPYLAFGGADPGRVTGVPEMAIGDANQRTTAADTVSSDTEFSAPGEGTNQIPRALLALSVSNYVVDSLKQIPGRKSLILLSGGLPLFQVAGGTVTGDIGQIFNILTDNATRSGVVINTMDVRGLSTAGATAKFADTPGRSALGSLGDSTIGRGFDVEYLGERPLTEQLTLRALAEKTGGITVVNTSNFSAGLDRVLNRSKGYYRLAYRPSEKFDGKFHHVEIKVRRGGVHTYTAEGYYAREDKSAKELTKEQQIIRVAASPLAKRDLAIATELQYRFLPANMAHLDINTFVDARQLQFATSDDGKHHASFDIAGFVFDQLGRVRGGISQTINAALSDEEYQRALTHGITYTASTDAPPGYYQVRLVVREVGTGKVGSVARYFEVPDLSNKQLTMSSIMLYQVGATEKSPQQLAPTRIISRANELRYAVVVYNPKLGGNKPEAKSQLIISQGGRILFKEPEQPIEPAGANPGEFIKLGQLVLHNVNPGRYILTLVVTDPLADKKRATVSRSVDFTVVK